MRAVVIDSVRARPLVREVPEPAAPPGGVVLRVTEPRQPCAKFNAVMGDSHAGKAMVQSGRCGFYLAVERAGKLQAGETFILQAGAQQTSIAQALEHKAFKHLR